MKQLIVLTMILFTSGCTNTRELDTLNILVFSKTEGYRHESISSGTQMLTNQQLQQKWNVTASEDAGIFNDEYLGGIDVVVFLNPSGDALNENNRLHLKSLSGGKGFVGIHSSADFEYEWPWYGQLNGAHFKVHPPSQEGTLIIEDTSHPAMKPFSGMKTFTTYDEWYTFKSNPRTKCQRAGHTR
jgi:uncharacterized protein